MGIPRTFGRHCSSRVMQKVGYQYHMYFKRKLVMDNVGQLLNLIALNSNMGASSIFILSVALMGLSLCQVGVVVREG